MAAEQIQERVCLCCGRMFTTHSGNDYCEKCYLTNFEPFGEFEEAEP